MSNLRKVLVPLSVEPAERSSTQRHFARAGYVDKLLKYGLTPILVPTTLPEQMLISLYQECSGVLLMGGDDYDPHLFGEVPHPQTDRPSIERDTLEQRVLHMTLRDRKPLLGICRGCQGMAIASGGSLFQHIPDLPNALSHKAAAASSYGQAVSVLFHEIAIEPDSQLAQILGKTAIQTNSAHHQSVRSVGPDFRIVAYAKDGIVEGIEHRDAGYFCIGIQSHPEAMEPSFMEPLFERFAAVV